MSVPVINKTTDGGLSEELRTYYDKTFLSRLLPNIIWPLFGMPKPMPKRAGQTVRWNGFLSLSPVTEPLSEGVTPDGSALDMTHLEASPIQYADYVKITDLVDMTSPDPILTNILELQGGQAAASYDVLVRDVLVAATNRHYIGDRAGTSSVTAADVWTVAEARKIVRTFSKNKIPKLSQILSASDGVGTAPVPASFVAICGPDTEHDLKGTTGFVPVHQYPNPSNVIHPDEIGSLDQIRFIKSDQAKIKTGEGHSGTDVHVTVVLGQGAYGIVSLSGFETIVKDFGAGDDPLNQRATAGWKAMFVAKIIQPLAVCAVEHAVSA